MSPSRARDRSARHGGLAVLGYVVVGVLGSVVLTRVSVGSFPWQPVGLGPIKAWQTFDGFFACTFGFILTIGVAILLTNLLGSGITCPRCGARNRADAAAYSTCNLAIGDGPASQGA